MAVELLKGIGDLHIISSPSDLSESIMTLPCANTWVLSGESTELEGQKFNASGTLVTGASDVGETTYTLTMSTQVINWDNLGFFNNERPATDASVTIPVIRTGTVPSTSPYEVTDTDITGANESDIYVYLTDGAKGTGPRTKAGTPASPAAGEVGVDTTNTKFVFNAADAGKTFSYRIPVTHTNLETYGGANTASFGTIAMWGIQYPLDIPIYFPSLNFKSIPSRNYDGSVATLEVEFSANVTTGNNKPYQEWKTA